jgi:hypothetical protein
MTHPRPRSPILTRLRSKQDGPDWAAALPAAMLCVTVSVIHVLDQGGVTKYAGPPWWLGWGYWLVEAGGVLAALVLVARRRWMPAWIAAFFVGFGPFTGFLLTRLAGLPGDPGDFGNWGDPLGTASLFVEGTLMVIAISSILHLVRVNRGLPAGAAAATGPRLRERTGVLARAESDAA